MSCDFFAYLVTSVAECLFGDKTDILLEWAAADNEGTETRVHSC
jgi:hypothetical protein